MNGGMASRTQEGVDRRLACMALPHIHYEPQVGASFHLLPLGTRLPLLHIHLRGQVAVPAEILPSRPLTGRDFHGRLVSNTTTSWELPLAKGFTRSLARNM